MRTGVNVRVIDTVLLRRGCIKRACRCKPHAALDSCRYLANKYPEKGLAGTDATSRALVDNWLEAEAANFNPHVSVHYCDAQYMMNHL